MTEKFPLDRFVEVQILTYAPALAELRRGAKRTHWMWWIFPQLAKLGRSSTAQQFAIHSVKEAQAYLDHPILGPRYLECVTALQDLNTSDADRSEEHTSELQSLLRISYAVFCLQTKI